MKTVHFETTEERRLLYHGSTNFHLRSMSANIEHLDLRKRTLPLFDFYEDISKDHRQI